MSASVVIGVVSAVAAVSATAVAGTAVRIAKAIARTQHRIDSHSIVGTWSAELRDWSGTCIDVLADASYCCKCDDDSESSYAERMRECRTRLSALIDRGRFFFPNIPAPGIGDDKPSAYRGWRHPVLDPLVAAELVLGGSVGSGRFQTKEAALTEMRRIFVSHVQRVLAPEAANAEIARLVRSAFEYREADETLGGLLPTGPIPTGAEQLLYLDKPRDRR